MPNEKGGPANPSSVLSLTATQLEEVVDPIHYDFPAAPLAFDAERQLRWVLWYVLPPGVEEGSSADCVANPARSCFSADTQE